METLRVPLGERSYPIYIGEGLLYKIPHFLNDMGQRGMILIITDSRVNPIYGSEVAQKLKEGRRGTHILEVPQGERTKTLRWASRIYAHLLSLHADRSTLLLALGGGMVGDLTGFVAATYMRGIPYIQVPTTLLAQVDSSVGGKTAVNHPRGKNLIGAFYQPRAVVADTRALSSLPRREFLSGLAEVVKYGVITDRSLFFYIKDNMDAVLQREQDALIHIIKRSCAIKAEVVSKDEREAGLRTILNFGHTIGHAVESLTGYRRLKHGECVSIGMAFAARLSRELGLCPHQGDADELISLLDNLGLPTELPELNPHDIISALLHDKKVLQGKLRFVLMEGLGKVIVKEGIEEALLFKTLTRENMRVS